ncbi:glycosyltransferase [Patescibacteria group bacterium]|nr:glycosyltransferase [Patescibacteria group bacterium]
MLIIEILVYFSIFLGLYFALFVFNLFLENQKGVYKKPKIKNFPTVALIVPCYNEAENIEKTLNSLLNLDYPKEKLEIIVIDDGSTDDTFLKAQIFEKKDKRIKVFTKKNGGKYTALNLGLKKTNAPFIGSMDADSHLDPQALKKVMKFFENPEIKAVSGTVKVREVKNIIEGIQYLEYLISAYWKKFFSMIGGLQVASGAFSVFRKEVFKILGHYQDPYNCLAEDLEITFRLQQKNFKIAQALDAFVYTRAPSNFKSLFRQRSLRWYKGFLLTLKDYLGLLNIKKHGNLSFLLYATLVGVFASLILSSYTLWRAINFCWERVNQLFLTGFDFPYFFSLFWDKNFFNFKITPLFILGNICLIFFLIQLSIAKKLCFDKKPLKVAIFSFIFLYGYLNVLWWGTAIISILKEKITKFYV